VQSKDWRRRLTPGAVFCALCLALSSTSARADQVTQEIDRAKQAYLQGKLNDTKLSLDMASQLVSQAKTKILNSILPPPFLGWTADVKTATADAGTVSGTATGAASAFGGITASRSFKKDGKICNVTVAGESPILAAVSMFLANPQLAQASGAKLARVNNQRAVITQDGEVQVLLGNNYLVTVTGDCSESDKLAYAGAVDYSRLAAF
jgi:hypothetical protein